MSDKHARLIRVAHELKEVAELDLTKTSRAQMRKLLTEADNILASLGGTN